jgi:hypothetical protein
MKTPWMPLVLVGAITGAVGFALGRQMPRDEPASETSSMSMRAPEPAAAMPELPEIPDEDPHQQNPHQAGITPGAPDQTIEGTLRDHKDVAEYTYLHIALEAGETWAAVYKTPVKDGQKVVVEHAARIEGFHSKELNRDFSEIWFGTLPTAM